MAAKRWPLWVVGTGLFVLLSGANLATPLYAVYRRQFGFTGTVLTLIFVTYAIVLIPSLLIFGQLSDRIGRRRVMALGLGVATVGLALFAAAQSTLWLFAARAVQGLAVGIITGTATAALVEQEPRKDERRAALVATLAQAGGGGAGPLLGGALAEWAPAPMQLPYVVGAIAAGAMGFAVLRVPERHPAGGRWRPQLPSVPAEIRAPFVRAGLTAGTVWAVGALFLSVIPSYAGTLLETSNLALLGSLTALMLGTACAAQVLSLRVELRPAVGQIIGLLGLVGGLAALLAAFPPRSMTLLLVGAVVAGAGFGLGFVGAQSQINHLAPGQRRGEVTAAFISCVYAGVSVAAVGVGLLSDLLSLFAAVGIVSAVIAAVAVFTAAWHLRALAD